MIMPAMPVSSKGRRPIEKPHGHDRHNHIYLTHAGCRQNSLSSRIEAGELEDGRRVINDRINPSDLLKYRQSDADDERVPVFRSE
jgi:hypothetical protein